MIEGFRDVLAMMVTIIGIAYPLVMSILRSSIKGNEDWMTVALTSYDDMLFDDCYSEDEERRRRGKVLGYYNTLDELLGWQVIAGLWAWCIIFAGSSILLFPDLLYGGHDLFTIGAILLFSLSVWGFFGGLLYYSIRSANHQREYLDATVMRVFGERVWLIRKSLFSGEWKQEEVYDSEAKGKILYRGLKEEESEQRGN